MPLVNIIGINNYGHNVFLAFGLLTDEKKDSYEWLFEQLRKAWNKEPENFITDDCAEIQKGKELFIGSFWRNNSFFERKN